MGLENMKLHRSIYLKELKSTFPELQEKVNGAWGLLHVEMDVFTSFTQLQIDAGNSDNVAKCFDLANKCFQFGNHKLVNAINVSFLEHLNFEDGKVAKQWAWNLMPETLRQGYSDIMEYNEQLRLARLKDKQLPKK
jgi:hypothetical protein